MSLKRILDEKTFTRLSNNGITTSIQLFYLSPIQIMTILEVTYLDVCNILNLVSEKVSPKSVSAYEMFNSKLTQNSYLSTGSEGIDNLFMGGLPVGILVEISGSAGTGKTQFCFGCLAQLIVIHIITIHNLFISLMSMNIKVTNLGVMSSSYHTLYIDTELKFNLTRLREIILAKAVGIEPELVENGD